MTTKGDYLERVSTHLDVYIYIYICFGILGKFCYLAFISYIFKVLRFSRYKVILSLFHLVDVVNPFKYKVKEKKCEC